MGEMTAGARRAWPLYLFLAGLSLPIFVMYAWLLIASFSGATHGLRPVGGFTLAHWRFLWEPVGRNWPSIWAITVNSLVLALAVTAALLAVSTTAGYALSRLNFPGRKSLLFGAIILHSFPAITLLIALFLVLRALRLYDNLGGVVLVKMALELPFAVWLIKGFFDNISWDMEMAAMVDGCSRLRAWLRVMLPQVKPGLGALAIFGFLSGWNEFILPFIFLPSSNNHTLAVVVHGLGTGTRFVDYGLLTALSVFYMIPVLIFFLLTQRYLLSIYTGGVKA
ncbi:MAG: carbohydrate ABC transporter permease [Actinomycetota bacterium]|nr:carbohydrate ABC transporter permease [Actinomycetota bacterium]